jgi:hypothetical protein
MIFFPFNPDISYNERSFNSFVGSINLSEITQSTLKLNFDTPCASVKIYSINMSGYTQSRSEIITSQNIINTHLIEDFTRHSLIQIERIEIYQIVNDIRTNTIIENDVNTIQYSNNNYSGMSGPNYYFNSSTNNSIEDLIVDIGESKLIPEERKTCGINLEEIQTVQKYMSCAECGNNFNEISIKIWLTNSRTCPSCRSNWCDFNVYINV